MASEDVNLTEALQAVLRSRATSSSNPAKSCPDYKRWVTGSKCRNATTLHTVVKVAAAAMIDSDAAVWRSTWARRILLCFYCIEEVLCHGRESLVD